MIPNPFIQPQISAYRRFSEDFEFYDSGEK
jgi:hypothetical protein